MPLYEYVCNKCLRRFTWLVGMVAGSEPPTCDRCGSTDAARREVSRFSRLRGSEETLDALADPAQLGDMDDPSTMRKWVREVGSEIGEGLGDEFEEYIDSAESGDE